MAAGTSAVAAATIALAVAFSGSLRHIGDRATTVAAINDAVRRWLGPGTDLQIRRVSLDGSAVAVELAGSQVPPATSALADALVPTLGSDASVRIRWSQRTSDAAREGTVPTPAARVANDTETLRPTVEAWLHTARDRGAGLEILSMRRDGNHVTVEVGGPTAPPPARSLAAGLAAERRQRTKVTVRWSPRQEFAASSHSESTTAPTTLRARQAVDSWARSRPEAVVLGLTVANGVATVDLAAQEPPPDLAALVAEVRSRAGTSTVVRLAPLRQVSPTAP
ncbi:MAG: hypothetical protein M3N28_08560 [Actinomycetota bacterium]|nr:hypothetical protein [Actinomycetota bacterium]